MKKYKREDFFGEHGLRGDSGLLPPDSGMIHVSANYDCNGMVFVSHYDEEYCCDVWTRMPLDAALKEERDIISCSKCEKPAISLDHHWPYDSQYNYCEDHKNTKVTI